MAPPTLPSNAMLRRSSLAHYPPHPRPTTYPPLQLYIPPTMQTPSPSSNPTIGYLASLTSQMWLRREGYHPSSQPSQVALVAGHPRRLSCTLQQQMYPTQKRNQSHQPKGMTNGLNANARNHRSWKKLSKSRKKARSETGNLTMKRNPLTLTTKSSCRSKVDCLWTILTMLSSSGNLAGQEEPCLHWMTIHKYPQCSQIRCCMVQTRKSPKSCWMLSRPSRMPSEPFQRTKGGGLPPLWSTHSRAALSSSHCGCKLRG
mmetsp:Transcript_3403/g.4666  ORF Transcript_3403/g.4666 Transcript_3403/m.4666 type:complete len:258 (+) Transcript_3403:1057-1830(+)